MSALTELELEQADSDDDEKVADTSNISVAEKTLNKNRQFFFASLNHGNVMQNMLQNAEKIDMFQKTDMLESEVQLIPKKNTVRL